MKIQGFRIEAKLYIEGQAYDVTQATATYALSTIPKAAVVLPVGYDLTRNDALSRAHRLVREGHRRVPAYLSVTITRNPRVGGESPAPLNIPDGCAFILFDGYVDSVTAQKYFGSMAVRVGLSHWTVGLDDASLVSPELAPDHPLDLRAAAYLQLTDVGTTQWVGLTALDSICTPDNLRTDFWEKVLRPYFKSVLSHDILEETVLPGGGKLAPRKSTYAGLTALGRFQPSGDAADYVPLALKQNIWPDISLQVSAALTKLRDLQFVSHTSAWDLLVMRIAPQFLFAVIPRPMDAIPAPVMPILQDVYAEIPSEEFSAIRLPKRLERPIRACLVLTDIYSDVGDTAPAPKQHNSLLFGPGGWYVPNVPADQVSSGMLLVRRAPSWMAQPFFAPIHSGQAAGIEQGGAKPVGCASDPGAGSPNPNGPLYQDRLKAYQDLLGAYAKALYGYEAARRRSATLHGPFRVDIAPGSRVRILLDPGKAPRGLGRRERRAVFHGLVTAVTLVLDTTSPGAGTGFQLEYVRTEAENEQDASLFMTEHPLWATPFVGAPLIRCGG